MSTNGYANGSSGSDDGHVDSFWTRYEHLKVQDVIKNVLLEVCTPVSHVRFSTSRARCRLQLTRDRMSLVAMRICTSSTMNTCARTKRQT